MVVSPMEKIWIIIIIIIIIALLAITNLGNWSQNKTQGKTHGHVKR